MGRMRLGHRNAEEEEDGGRQRVEMLVEGEEEEQEEAEGEEGEDD